LEVGSERVLWALTALSKIITIILQLLYLYNYQTVTLEYSKRVQVNTTTTLNHV